jgi:hypothetical protein
LFFSFVSLDYGWLLLAMFIQFIITHRIKYLLTVAIVVRVEWRACLEVVIGYSRVIVYYLYTPEVGINTVDAFTEIPAASFNAWSIQTSKNSNFHPWSYTRSGGDGGSHDAVYPQQQVISIALLS